jgi:hypothetical protein
MCKSHIEDFDCKGDWLNSGVDKTPSSVFLNKPSILSAREVIIVQDFSDCCALG